MKSISARFALVILLAGTLSACVVERTGGFNAEVSQEAALRNYLQLALSYLNTNDLVNTRRHLANAAAIDPDNAEMFGIWGLVYAREGDLDVAEENFQRALRLDRNGSLTRNNYSAFLFSNGRFEEAYEQLQIVVTDIEYEGRPQAYENLGLTALRLGRESDAWNAFNRAIQLNQNQVRSLTELMDLSFNRNDLAQAQRFYNSILTLQQFYGLAPNPRNLLQGIRLAEAQGNNTQATTLAAQLRTSFPNSREYQQYRQSNPDE